MTPETLKALKGSIDKWERIVDCEGKDGGKFNCDLCSMFALTLAGCGGCPAGSRCLGTPYDAWQDYQIENYKVFDYAVFDQKSYNLALAELEFLKSLLPPTAPTEQEDS
jgi:hypothetical protein